MEDQLIIKVNKNSNNFSKEILSSIDAAFQAGSRIMQIYNSEDFKIQSKGDDSPLTVADIESNKIINELLSSKFNYPILSEEEKTIPYEQRSKWNLFWMIDPIDGTKEFIKKNDEFTVNIALIEKNTPILGVVYAPALGILYYADKNIGSFRCKNVYDMKSFMKKKSKDLRKSIFPDIYSVIVSRSHMNDRTKDYVENKKLLHKKINCLSFGSSLKICKVADGSAHCYPRFGPTMEWDTAAGHAVVKYAGYNFSTFDGKKINYNKKNLLNSFFIVESENYA